MYRLFCESADQAESSGWDILKPLRADLEACYTNWYVPNLAIAWGKFVEPQGPTRLLAKWRIDRVPNQQEFYDNHVRSRLDEADNRKAFVIISDAFRYEAAQELTQELNGKYRFEATLTSQLGRAALLHGAGHGEPPAAQGPGLQAERRRARGRQAHLLHRRAERDPGGLRRDGLQGW